MFRASDIVLIAVMLSAAAVTYRIKDRAEGEVTHIAKLRQQIRLEKDQLDVLKADWSLMTQPARLQRLAERYNEQLQLAPVEASQIAVITNLPIDMEVPGDDPIGAIASNGRDSTITGAVKP